MRLKRWTGTSPTAPRQGKAKQSKAKQNSQEERTETREGSTTRRKANKQRNEEQSKASKATTPTKSVENQCVCSFFAPRDENRGACSALLLLFASSFSYSSCL